MESDEREKTRMALEKRDQAVPFHSAERQNRETFARFPSELEAYMTQLYTASRFPWISAFLAPRLMKRIKSKRMAKRLRNSGYFDYEWYLQQNPDVAEADIDAAQHFIEYGYAEGRTPSPRFDSPFPIDTHPDEDLDAPIPHYGKGLDNLVRAARRRTRSLGHSDEYDVIRSEFDIAYYLTRYQDIARATRLDPVQHFLNAGAKEGRNPSPHFSTKQYCARYPEVDESGLNPFYHWLTVGRERGYIAEAFSEFEGMCRILGRPPQEVQALLTERRSDLRERLEHGKLGEMVAKAAELDPLIAHSWPEALQIKLPPFHSEPVVSRVVAMHRLQEAAEFKRARFVIVINRPRWGGGPKDEGFLARALSEIDDPSEVAVIYTDDTGDEPSNRFPEGCRKIDFASIVNGLKEDSRQQIFVEFLRSLRPESAFNVNSRLFWDTLKPYGQALAADMNLYVYLFCNEQTLFGYWTGYPARYFYRNFDLLSGVLVDSQFLADDLSHSFRLPAGQRAKIEVLPAPADMRVPAAQRTQDDRRKVYWSGRFDRQKRPDLVYEIARCLPEVEFHMWGKPMLDSFELQSRHPPNVNLEGVYGDFLDLPLESCDVWLYTSEWDGVPHLLLEVAMTGIPIVGSLVGGNGEVLHDDFTWPVRDVGSASAYVAAIEEVLRDPAGARARARSLRDWMGGKRSMDAYTAAVTRALTNGRQL